MNKRKNKVKIVIILATVFLLCFYFAIFAGYRDNGVNLVMEMFHPRGGADSIILETLRLPRALKAAVAGICLALSGLLLQSVSKNPLAEPYITGISSGAGIGIVTSLTLFAGVNYSLFGFLGAIITAILVIIFTGLSKFSITKLILIGLSINLFASSVISLIILMNPDKAYILMFILSGGVVNNDVASNSLVITLFALGMILCAFMMPKLNFLRLDDNLVQAISKKSKKDTLYIIIISAFLASISVFCAGIIGFVGIIAPQISKILLGEDYRWLFLANIFIGASIMLFADFCSRVIIYPVEIPLGLVVSLIGAPVFVYFLMKKEGGFNG